MGKPLAITRIEHTAEDLRAMASKSRDRAQVRRLLALASVLDGQSRTEAAAQAGMDRQTPRDRVHRYSAEGIEGLKSGHGPGKPPSLTGEQMAELKATVLKGPDPEQHGVVRWRCVYPRAEVARRFTVEVTERTIGKWLRKLELTRLQPRPFHPKKDDAAQAAYKKLRRPGEGSPFGQHLAGWPTGRDLVPGWLSAEEAINRVGQKGGHAYTWAEKGSRPLMVRDNRHDSAYLLGAICPARAVGAAIIMPTVNAEAVNEHLKEISTQVTRGAHAMLVVDGAGWHQTGGKLIVPDNITLLPLPPYAPELNPMENVWEYLRQNKLCALVWDTYEAIVQACRDASKFLVDDPARIQSIGTREWACVNV